MFSFNGNANSTPDIENASDFAPVWIQHFNQVIQDLVDYVLMECAFVAVRPQVKFKRFRFDHFLVRYILDMDFSKIWLAGLLPPAPFWTAGFYSTPEQAQQAYQAILGFTPRLLLASFLAYLVGEFLNSFVMARLKVRTAGRYLWLRTISSTILGEGADSLVFITIAFWGIFPLADLGTAIVSQWLFKVVFEVIATPFTYWIVNTLKRVEREDYFDRDTDFSPVVLK